MSWKLVSHPTDIKDVKQFWWSPIYAFLKYIAIISVKKCLASSSSSSGVRVDCRPFPSNTT